MLYVFCFSFAFLLISFPWILSGGVCVLLHSFVLILEKSDFVLYFLKCRQNESACGVGL